MEQQIPVYYSWIAKKIAEQGQRELGSNIVRIHIGRAKLVLGMSYRLPKHIRKEVLAELVAYGLLVYENQQQLIYVGGSGGD